MLLKSLVYEKWHCHDDPLGCCNLEAAVIRSLLGVERAVLRSAEDER